MSDYAITIKGLDEVVRKFDAAQPVVREELYRAMYRAVTGELGRMPSYPSKPAGPMQFVSDKQRRWFFWALRQGLIEVPYVRTLQLGRSLTSMVGQAEGARSRIEQDGADIRGYVGTSIKYAELVIGNNQAPVHRGRWWRLEASILGHKRQIEAEFEAAARTITEKLATD